jgi:hypothetical protein
LAISVLCVKVVLTIESDIGHRSRAAPE